MIYFYLIHRPLYITITDYPYLVVIIIVIDISVIVSTFHVNQLSYLIVNQPENTLRNENGNILTDKT